MGKKFKISILPLIVGIIMLIAGVVIIVSANNRYSQLKKDYNAELAQYEADYDKWYDEWWNDHTATLNDQPKHPGLEPGFPGWGFGGVGLLVFSVPFLFTGITTLFASKKKTEDKLEAITNTQNTNSDTTNFLDLLMGKKKTTTCEYCGASIEDGKTTCNNCGARVKK